MTRKWYEFRSHAKNNKEIIFTDDEYNKGAFGQLEIAIELETDKDIKRKLQSARDFIHSQRFEQSKKTKKEKLEEQVV